MSREGRKEGGVSLLGEDSLYQDGLYSLNADYGSMSSSGKDRGGSKGGFEEMINSTPCCLTFEQICYVVETKVKKKRVVSGPHIQCRDHSVIMVMMMRRVVLR